MDAMRNLKTEKLLSLASVRETPPLVDEVSANFGG
jgi:hypothetical protein